MTSDLFKFLIVVFLSGFVPVTVLSFVTVRRTRKEAEFARVVRMLGIATDEAEFARTRVTEEFASRDFVFPMLFAWSVSVLGFYSLLFGADLVSEHRGKANLLLTATFTGTPEAMQLIRFQSMVVLSLGFLGAYLWSAQNVIRRLIAGDLAPGVYFNAGLRMTLAPLLSLMMALLLTGPMGSGFAESGLPIVAFLVGFFPDEAMQFLKERVPPFLRTSRHVAHALPLHQIEGVTAYDRLRLNEIGVDDAQNLATTNFIEIVVRTPFNPGQIVDWIAQARLLLYFKDETMALRKQQVRTVFDLMLRAENKDGLHELAEATGLTVSGLELFCDGASNDPSVAQLLSFRDRLCCNFSGNIESGSVHSIEIGRSGHRFRPSTVAPST